jgi:malate dehydrogenase (oxaloacetate-decarboxylating)
MPDEKELVKKAEKPGRDAMRLHPHFRGKIRSVLKCGVRDMNDFAIWYTPGVAKPCLDIKDNPDMVFDHTNKANMLAVISNGTRVLGLGDIGAEASIPVMEGKALLFKYLGGVDAWPICLDTKDPELFIEIVMQVQPCFGGINLEDIRQPDCFHILDTLREKARIPIWHDDQQGTAAVTVAGLINALKIANKDIDKARVGLIGAGAANVAIYRLLKSVGINPDNVIVCDSKATLHSGRIELQEKYKEKWTICQETNPDNILGGMTETIKGADVIICLSKSGPDIIKPEHIKSMAKDPIVFACANPVPEIWPWVAKEAGAKIVATGRSDFPNQVNNSLGFPGIFRGTLDVRAKTITDEMCVAAALELAKVAEDKGLREDYIIPNMDEWEVFPREAVAVGMKAIEQGVARIKFTHDELLKVAEENIKAAREETEWMMKEGWIKKFPPEPKE